MENSYVLVNSNSILEHCIGNWDYVYLWLFLYEYSNVFWNKFNQKAIVQNK